MSENVITKQLGVEMGDLQRKIGADKEQLYEEERKANSDQRANLP